MTHRLLWGFFALVQLTACQQHDASQTGASVAAVDQQGNVHTREPTAEELARVQTSQDKIEEINRRFPRAEIPAGVSPSTAVGVLPTGAVELSDGRKVRLDGLKCSDAGLEYLARLLVDPNSSLLVVPTGQIKDGVVPADVWTLEKLDGGALSYSFPAETALTSGWCDVDPSMSKQNDRYRSLVEAFHTERQAAARAAR
jgi:hypothetical protein